MAGLSVFENILTVALIYQSRVETCADLRVGVVVRKDARVILEHFASSQSQSTNQRLKTIVINVLRP